MRELARRSVDLTYLDVQAIRGVIRLYGRVRMARSVVGGDIDSEMYKIVEIIRRIPEVRDVVDESTHEKRAVRVAAARRRRKVLEAMEEEEKVVRSGELGD